MSFKSIRFKLLGLLISVFCLSGLVIFIYSSNSIKKLAIDNGIYTGYLEGKGFNDDI